MRSKTKDQMSGYTTEWEYYSRSATNIRPPRVYAHVRSIQRLAVFHCDDYLKND